MLSVPDHDHTAMLPLAMRMQHNPGQEGSMFFNGSDFDGLHAMMLRMGGSAAQQAHHRGYFSDPYDYGRTVRMSVFHADPYAANPVSSIYPSSTPIDDPMMEPPSDILYRHNPLNAIGSDLPIDPALAHAGMFQADAPFGMHDPSQLGMLPGSPALAQNMMFQQHQAAAQNQAQLMNMSQMMQQQAQQFHHQIMHLQQQLQDLRSGAGQYPQYGQYGMASYGAYPYQESGMSMPDPMASMGAEQYPQYSQYSMSSYGTSPYGMNPMTAMNPMSTGYYANTMMSPMQAASPAMGCVNSYGGMMSGNAAYAMGGGHSYGHHGDFDDSEDFDGESRHFHRKVKKRHGKLFRVRTKSRVFKPRLQVEKVIVIKRLEVPVKVPVPMPYPVPQYSSTASQSGSFTGTAIDPLTMRPGELVQMPANISINQLTTAAPGALGQGTFLFDANASRTVNHTPALYQSITGMPLPAYGQMETATTSMVPQYGAVPGQLYANRYRRRRKRGFFRKAMGAAKTVALTGATVMAHTDPRAAAALQLANATGQLNADAPGMAPPATGVPIA